MAYVGPSTRRQGVYCHEHWETVGYPLLSSNYHYTVRDVFVEGNLTETYKAQTNVERQVSYIFEVPPEASVVRFSAQVGNTLVTAIVDEKAEANKKYQQAVTAGFQAWKLDKVNDEVFQISLGNVKPNESIIVQVAYVYVISSDTIEDSARLTIPCGLAARPGGAPASQTTMPKAAPGKMAVTITVGIEAMDGQRIAHLTSLGHLATITYGFSDNSFKRMNPRQEQQAFSVSKAYVEFSSAQFLSSHFVLVWTVPRLDDARCVFERKTTMRDGKSVETTAFALTVTSNIQLDVAEHEYIFLVDKSASMAGSRIETANAIVSGLLKQLPSAKNSTFNIYYFAGDAQSVLGSRSLVYDSQTVRVAGTKLNRSTGGSKSISTSLATVLSQRDKSKRHCSVIVITDGLDWNITAAIKKVEAEVRAAMAVSKLLRVFVMGLGDTVSRGMCEALARAGAGATAYISESQLLEHDHLIEKGRTMINAINRAPIPPPAAPKAAPPGEHAPGGRTLPGARLGPAAKGDNLAAPKPIQQAPLPGTLFWAVRSYWYAIIDGDFSGDTKARIVYDVPLMNVKNKQIDATYAWNDTGSLIHTLAARALIQTLEDKALSITNANDKYYNEAEIVRLGKTYSLASTQTSFVATMNGVGTVTRVKANAPPGAQTLLAGVPLNDPFGPGSKLQHIVATPPTPATPARGEPSFDAGIANAFRGMHMRANMTHPAIAAVPDNSSPAAGEDDLAQLIATQDAKGAFDPSTVARVVFPRTSVPAAPAFISVLENLEEVKEQIWLAVCAIAFFQKKHVARRSEWADARAKAEKFVKTTLCCVFGVDSNRTETIFANSLEDAEGYFY